MRLLADENIDQSVVLRLRRDGHRVEYVLELTPGITDEQVLRRAVSSGAVLITEDKDFGELVFRNRLRTSGVVLVRLAGVSAVRRAAIVASAISAHARKLKGSFTVITHGAVRIRRTRSGN
jgi:predicted nuclease of predicted toxin-antitoxin system